MGTTQQGCIEVLERTGLIAPTYRFVAASVVSAELFEFSTLYRCYLYRLHFLKNV